MAVTTKMIKPTRVPHNEGTWWRRSFKSAVLALQSLSVQSPVRALQKPVLPDKFFHPVYKVSDLMFLQF